MFNGANNKYSAIGYAADASEYFRGKARDNSRLIDQTTVPYWASIVTELEPEVKSTLVCQLGYPQVQNVSALTSYSKH